MERRQSRADVGGLTTIGTRVPAALKRRLRVYCAERGVEMRHFVEEAVRERLAGEQRRRRSGRVS